MSAGIPSDLQPIFTGLHNDLVGLQIRWIMFRQLFCVSEERVNLLQKMAPAYFAIARDTLVDDVLIGIARITDKPVVCGKDTLVLRQLLERLGATVDAAFIAKLQAKWDTAKAACDSITVVRHNRLAHRNLQAVLDPKANPLPAIDREHIDDALAAISAFMNTFQNFFTGDTIMYAQSIPELGDGDSLILHLQRADAYRNLESDGRVPRIRSIIGQCRPQPSEDCNRRVIDH